MHIEEVAIAISEAKVEAYSQRKALLKKAHGLHADGFLLASHLHILETLLNTFWNASTGLCCPNVETLQDALHFKYSRPTIFRGFDALEALGIMVREARRFPQEVTEKGRRIVKFVQASNLYHFNFEAKEFFVSIDAVARKQARKMKRIANMAVKQAALALCLSESHDRTPKPDPSIIMLKQRTTVAEESGVATPHSVPDTSGAPAKPVRMVSSGSVGARSNLKAALARMQAGVWRRNATAP